MKRHIVTRTERNILSALRRWNKDAPEEVLAAEARYRLQVMVLGAAEAGATQQSIAERHGYSVSQIERILKAARRDQAAGRVPPLTAWRAHDEAIAPEIETVTIGIDTQPPMASTAVAWTATDGSRAWILTLDGNDLTLSGVPTPPAPAFDLALATLVKQRGPMLTSAVRLLQLAAGIPATGNVDPETLRVVTAISAWQSLPGSLVDTLDVVVEARRA